MNWAASLQSAQCVCELCCQTGVIMSHLHQSKMWSLSSGQPTRKCTIAIEIRIHQSSCNVYSIVRWQKILNTEFNDRPKCTGSPEPFTMASLFGRHFRRRYRPHRKSPKCDGRVPTGLFGSLHTWLMLVTCFSSFTPANLRNIAKCPLFPSPFPMKISTVKKLSAP